MFARARQQSLPCPSAALKMETVCFSETLVYTDESTRSQNPEEHHKRSILRYSKHSVGFDTERRL
jgi:hypothetical protein